MRTDQRPASYQAAISPESFAAAGRSGTALQLASPFSYRTYRENWIDKIAESIEIYEQTCIKHGHNPKELERMMLLPFFTHENGEEAQHCFGPFSATTEPFSMFSDANSNVRNLNLTITLGVRMA